MRVGVGVPQKRPVNELRELLCIPSDTPEKDIEEAYARRFGLPPRGEGLALGDRAAPASIPEIERLFISLLWDPTAFDKHLIIAAKEGYVGIVIILLDQTLVKDAVNVNARDDDAEHTALDWASLNGHMGVVTALLKRGADVSAASSATGVTPLMLAASRKRVDVVMALLNWGADATAVDCRGHSVLMWAVSGQRGGDVAIVTELLKRGAKIDAADRDGNTPLMRAMLEGYPTAAAKLVEEGAKFDDSTLPMAAYSGYAAVVALLIERGATVDASFRHYSALEGVHRSGTALMWAIVGGRTPVVVTLLSAGSRFTCVDELKNTALDVAIDCKRSEIAALLVARGVPHSRKPEALKRVLDGVKTTSVERVITLTRDATWSRRRGGVSFWVERQKERAVQEEMWSRQVAAAAAAAAGDLPPLPSAAGGGGGAAAAATAPGIS